MDLSELHTLLVLLKSEGVLSYVGGGHEIRFRPDAAVEQADDVPSTLESSLPPERVRGLNPNYLHPSLRAQLGDLLTDG